MDFDFIIGAGIVFIGILATPIIIATDRTTGKDKTK